MKLLYSQLPSQRWLSPSSCLWKMSNMWFQYGDPLLDQLDIHHVVHHRLFRESCFNHQGNYVKVRIIHSGVMVWMLISSVSFLGSLPARSRS